MPKTQTARWLDDVEARVRMVRRGHTVRSLAAALGISASSVTRWVRGTRYVPAHWIGPIEKELGPARGLWRKDQP